MEVPSVCSSSGWSYVGGVFGITADVLPNSETFGHLRRPLTIDSYQNLSRDLRSVNSRGALVCGRQAAVQRRTVMITKVILSTFAFSVLTIFVAFADACSSSKTASPVANLYESTDQTTETVATADQPQEEIDPSILDRLRNEHWKGDVDGLLERRYVRFLVLYNKTNFFMTVRSRVGLRTRPAENLRSF
jgi:hypothetical protein